MNLTYLDLFSPLIMAIAWGLLALRLWRSFKTEGGKISEFFYYFSFLLTLNFSFFSLNDIILALPLVPLKINLVLTINILAQVCLIGAFTCLGYLVIYIINPSLNLDKFIFFFLIILEIIIIVLNVFFPSVFYWDLIGRLHLDVHPFVGIFAFLIITGTALPLGILLIRTSFSFREKEERTKALWFGILCIMGVVVALFYAVIKNPIVRFSLSVIWMIGIILFIFLMPKKAKPTPSYDKEPGYKIEW